MRLIRRRPTEFRAAPHFSALTIARMPARIAEGNPGHASITADNSGSTWPSRTPSAPDSAPPAPEAALMSDEFAPCSTPRGIRFDCRRSRQVRCGDAIQSKVHLRRHHTRVRCHSVSMVRVLIRCSGPWAGNCAGGGRRDLRDPDHRLSGLQTAAQNISPLPGPPHEGRREQEIRS